jgi:hypothetical protein
VSFVNPTTCTQCMTFGKNRIQWVRWDSADYNQHTAQYM